MIRCTCCRELGVSIRVQDNGSTVFIKILGAVGSYRAYAGGLLLLAMAIPIVVERFRSLSLLSLYPKAATSLHF